ncbi:capsular biosynthesis protein [Cyanobacteria bacterium FACHB-DQ100]|nr:capsular biosynthesis protein [Cyanobacteria bacterium FACHB-DQ100]
MQSPSQNSSSTALNGSAPKVPQSPSPTGVPSSEEKDFRQYLQLVRRRWLAMSTVGLAALSFFVWRTVNTQPMYEGGFRLLVEPLNQRSSISGLTNEGSDPQSYDYDTQIQVLQGPELLSRSAAKLQSFQPGINYGTLRGGLTINRVPRTKLLEVRYRSSNAAEIRAVLDQLLKDYLNYSVNERQTDLNQGLKFVESQVNSAQGRVDQLQRQLQAFRQTYKLIEPDTEGGRVSTQADQLKQQRSALEQEIKKVQASLDSLSGATGAIVTLNNSATYQSLIEQMRQIESKIALESTRFGDGSVVIQDLKDKRANLFMLLRQEARNVVGAKSAEILTQLQSLEAQRQALAATERSLSQEFQQFPVLSRQYTDLQRELKIVTTSLERFLETREKLQVEASQKKIPWQVMEPPSQAALVSPNSSQELMTGAIASLALAIGTALLLEKIDTSYRNLEDIRKAIKVPILGQIPHEPMIQTEREWRLFLRKRSRKSKKGGKRPKLKRIETSATTLLALPITSLREEIDPDEVSELSEAFRVLRANLQQLNPTHPIRSIVVSSPAEADGKSTIALYLAQTISEMGQRVLLVDADFRRSQLQQRLQLPNESGLSQVLFENAPVQEVIQQPFADLPFFVLLKGSEVFDPVKVLSSPRMPELKQMFTQMFDFVIYDAPSLDDVADAVLLGPHTSGLLLVVRLQKTERLLVTKTLNNLSTSGIPVLGIAVNDT